MPRYYDRDDEDDESHLDDSEYPEPDDDKDDDGTAPCAYCGKPKWEDSERCPHCGNYGSREDEPFRKPWWLILGAGGCLLIILWWIMASR